MGKVDSHKDESVTQNGGAIAALIIGLLIMFIFIGSLVYKMIMKKRQTEGGRIMLNQESFRSDSRTPGKASGDIV